MSARDGYAQYYAEKLWQLVPEVYRNEDGLLPNPDVLREIVEVIADDAAQVRRSIDRLWEDQHIETCDDWAVPYLADLVGARLVSARDRRGRRIDVANAIYFRRRKGTPDALDTLVRAMSGWDVVLVEGFRRLARTRHRLDPLPVPVGPMTATPPGGTADLRNPVGAEVADGPFGEFFHTFDHRRLRGLDGRFGVRKLNFHLFRLRAYVMESVDPVLLLDPDGLGLSRTFSIDPSGRDIPLFIDGEPPEVDGVASTFAARARPCRAPPEWTVTHAMRCRLLGHVRYVITAAVVSELQQQPAPPTAADVEALVRLLGVSFRNETAMRRRLQDHGAGIPAAVPDWYRELVALALVDDCGKKQLYPAQVEIEIDGDPVPRHEAAAGDLSDRTCHPDPVGGLASLIVDPELGRFATVPPADPAEPEADVLRYVYGFSADVGAGPYPRGPLGTTARIAAGGVVPDSGLFQGDGLTLDDNRSYVLSIRSDTPVPDAALQASAQHRPYVRLQGDDDNLRGANLAPVAEGQSFVIDGGWYGSDDPDGLGDPADFVVEGIGVGDTAAFDFASFEIRHATFDPGGLRGDGIRIPTLRLRVRGQIDRLVIRRCIMGPIEVVRDAQSSLAHVEELIVCDSIVDASQIDDAPAIVSDFGRVVLESCTVFGDVHAHVLEASNSIVVGRVRVVNNQEGCFRFSASEPGPDVRLPPRYRDIHTPIPRASFNSLRFGDPQYAELSVVASEAIATGAEDGSEMGAFSHLLRPIRMQSVRAKLDEFGPVGQLAQFLFEGDRRPLSAVHAGPITPEPEPAPEVPPPNPGDVLPEPDPEPREPLPENCGDDPAPPLLPVGPAELVPRGAFLGGAPARWRTGDYRAETLPRRDEGGDEGVPFDRVSWLLELDALRGVGPSDQGWTVSEDAAQLELTNGAFRFAVDAGQPLVLRAEAKVPRRIDQLHAYTVLAVDRSDEANALAAAELDGTTDTELDKVDFAVSSDLAGAKGRGLRLGLGERDELGFVHMVSLDGARRRQLAGSGPGSRRAASWQTVFLQAHFGRDEAVVGVDSRFEREAASWFLGAEPMQPAPALVARLAIAPRRGQATGALRSIVLSSPGRFARTWLASIAPGSNPTLQLHFSVPDCARGRAPVAVHYGPREVGEPATRLPKARADAMLEANVHEDGALPSVAVTLKRIEADQPIWIVVERVPGHELDTLDGTVRLVAGTWKS